MDAKNVPTRRAQREMNTGDMELGHQPNIVLPDEGPLNYQAEGIAALEPDTRGDYLADLAFMEEPMTIRISKSSEKQAPKVVDCWNNGKGAEAFINGKWVELGWLPVDMDVITRRKYVEVLARAQPDGVETSVGEPTVEKPHNEIIRNRSCKYPMSIVQDKNPRGAAWMSKVLREG